MKAILKILAVATGFVSINYTQGAGASVFSYPAVTVTSEYPVHMLEMKLSEFIKLSARDFCSLSGKKLTLKERVSFMLLKKDMKKYQKKHPDQKVKDYLATEHKKISTGAWIAIIAGVILIFIIIIAATNSINVGLGWGGG